MQKLALVFAGILTSSATLSWAKSYPAGDLKAGCEQVFRKVPDDITGEIHDDHQVDMAIYGANRELILRVPDLSMAVCLTQTDLLNKYLAQDASRGLYEEFA